MSVLCLRVFICSSCSPPPYTLTSLLFLPLMPSLLTGLFRFPILKRRPHSLVHYSLCVIMHACTLLRSSFKRPLSLSFVPLNAQFTLPMFQFLYLINISLCVSLGRFFYRWGKFSFQRTADVSPIPFSQLAICFSSPPTTLIYPFTSASVPSHPYIRISHRTGVIAHSLTSHSSV